MNILAEGHSKDFQQLDQTWQQAEQHPLVQAYVVDMVDPHLAQPDRSPVGYSAVAVAAIANTSIRDMREIESTAILGDSLARHDVQSAATHLSFVRSNNTFSEQMDAADARYGHTADQSTLDTRQAKLDQARQELLGARMTVDELQPTLARGKQILATQRVLAKGALLLATLPPATLLGGAYGGLFWAADHYGNVHADKVGAHDTNDASAPGAVEVFPDAPEGSKIVHNPDGTFTITTTITEASQGEKAVNDYSRDGELTGTEFAADQAAARRSLQIVNDAHGNIKSVKIRAFSSDEASGPGVGLGKPDKINADLSVKRADKGEEAVTSTAQEMGLPIPGAQKEAQEAVLNPEQIAKIDAHAARLGMSRATLINRFNSDKTGLDTDALNDLDEYLAKNRGITLEMTVERETQVVQPHTEPQQEKNWADDAKKYKIGGVSLAWFIAGTATLTGGLLGTPFIGGIADRLARRRARSIMAKAERLQAKLDA
ncbi:MAG TPA: hypothetical protein VLI54_06905 [Bacillota bacterium]|nr:hypothetical protein [Bacillota bacterium]